MTGNDPQLPELKMLRQAAKEKSHSWGGVLGLGGQEGRSLLGFLQTVLFQDKRAKKGQLPVVLYPTVNSNHLLSKVRARHFTK